ncbi:MAG: tetratricopeptide repeat protein [Bacteroidales bacterium]|nr:tetratricopeptide repeat protein [Bacteroidales bacterium]
MKRTIYLFIVILSLGSTGNAQMHLPDSVSNIIISEASSVKKVAAILNHVDNDLINDEEYKKYFLDSAIRLSRQIGNDSLLAESLKKKGYQFLKNGRFDSSIIYFKDALDKVLQLPDERAIAQARFNLSEAYNHSGKADSALVLSDISLRYAQREEDSLLLFRIFNGRAMIYTHKGDYVRALDMLEKAFDYKSAMSPDILAVYYTRLGIVYFHLERYDQSVAAYNKTLEYGRKSKSSNLITIVYNNLGRVYHTA